MDLIILILILYLAAVATLFLFIIVFLLTSYTRGPPVYQFNTPFPLPQTDSFPLPQFDPIPQPRSISPVTAAPSPTNISDIYLEMRGPLLPFQTLYPFSHSTSPVHGSDIYLSDFD